MRPIGWLNSVVALASLLAIGSVLIMQTAGEQTVEEMAPGMADWTSSIILRSDDLIAGTGGLAGILVFDDQVPLHPRAPEELHPPEDVPRDSLIAPIGPSPFADHVFPARPLKSEQATEAWKDDLLGTPSLAPGLNKHAFARPVEVSANPTHSGISNSCSKNGFGGQGNRTWAEPEHQPRAPGSSDITSGITQLLEDVDNAMTRPALALLPTSTPTTTGRHVCRHVGCHGVFPTREGLRHHAITHIPDKKYLHRCSICPDRFFRYPKDVRRHELTHSDGKYVCFDCNRRFKREDHLKRHITKCSGSVISGRTSNASGSPRNPRRSRAHTTAGAETPSRPSLFPSSPQPVYQSASGHLAPPLLGPSTASSPATISSPASEHAYSPVFSPAASDSAVFSPRSSYDFTTPGREYGFDDDCAGADPASPYASMMYRSFSNGT